MRRDDARPAGPQVREPARKLARSRLIRARSGNPPAMAQLEVPPAAVEPRPNGRPEPPLPAPPARWAGDDAVPRGLAVASAVTLRTLIVVGGVVLLALFAKRMMVVVIPVIVALLR